MQPGRTDRLHLASLGGILFLSGYSLGVTSSVRMPLSDLLSNPPPPTLDSAVGPLTTARISFEAQVANLGKIPVGKRRLHTFRFANRGNDVLRLGNILSGCHCSAAYTQARFLKPGASGEVLATYDASGQPVGPFSRTLVLETNDSTLPLVRLELTGVVVP
jgi:hypothetical protein